MDGEHLLWFFRRADRIDGFTVRKCLTLPLDFGSMMKVNTQASNENDPEFLALPLAWQRILGYDPNWRVEVGERHLREILGDGEPVAPASHAHPPERDDPPEADVFLGRVVRYRRLRRRLPIRMLAEYAGIDEATMSRIERGRRSPRLSQLRRVAEALECSVADLVEGADVTECNRCGRRRVEHLRLCPGVDRHVPVGADAFG